MSVTMLCLTFFLLTFDAIDADRRIRDGLLSNANKSYVAYLIKAPLSTIYYDSWLCGGALVSTLYILTSAACIEDVDFIFAVVGYKKYVHDNELDIDKCTKDMKKKVVNTVVPKAYRLNYDKVEMWANDDIALAKVESAFNLADPKFISMCSYYPTIIRINYDGKYQEPGIDTLVFGWGHTKKWRTVKNTKNENQKLMQYTSCQIISKTECAKSYEAKMAEAINEFMICTDGPGILDEIGDQVVKSAPTANGCGSETNKLKTKDILNRANTRRNISEASKVINESMIEPPVLNNRSRLRNDSCKILRSTKFTRDSGICQNDHGSPLVTWVGKNEVLIGVATAFQVQKDTSDCIGPYLFTSTQCNGFFINCVLHGGKESWLNRRNEPVSCSSPPEEKGFDTYERHLSWLHHPAGPADNERGTLALNSQDKSNKTDDEESEIRDEGLQHNKKTSFRENKPKPRFKADSQIDYDNIVVVD